MLCSSRSELPDEAGTASSGELGKEIQRVEHADVFFEVVRVFRVEQHPALERFVADLTVLPGLPRPLSANASGLGTK